MRGKFGFEFPEIRFVEVDIMWPVSRCNAFFFFHFLKIIWENINQNLKLLRNSQISSQHALGYNKLHWTINIVLFVKAIETCNNRDDLFSNVIIWNKKNQDIVQCNREIVQIE